MHYAGSWQKQIIISTVMFVFSSTPQIFIGRLLCAQHCAITHTTEMNEQEVSDYVGNQWITNKQNTTQLAWASIRTGAETVGSCFVWEESLPADGRTGSAERGVTEGRASPAARNQKSGRASHLMWVNHGQGGENQWCDFAMSPNSNASTSLKKHSPRILQKCHRSILHPLDFFLFNTHLIIVTAVITKT